MALSHTERQILDDIRKDTKEARDASIRTETIVAAHATQISKLFTNQDIHADKIVALETRQVMCQEHQASQGNAAERKSNVLTKWANILMGLGILVSIALGVVNLFTS
jgi:hypothetical protein